MKNAPSDSSPSVRKEDGAAPAIIGAQPSGAPEKVGYGHPPLKNRWKKGESGNLKGRPYRRNIWASILEELGRVVTIKAGRKGKRITIQDLMLRQLITKATQGDKNWVEQVMHLMRQVEKPMPPEIKKSKFHEHLQSLMSKIIRDQNKAGYDRRAAEEKGDKKPDDFWGFNKKSDPPPSDKNDKVIPASADSKDPEKRVFARVSSR